MRLLNKNKHKISLQSPLSEISLKSSNMPQDLPGFYYDPDKNRYFPIKGPIPGSTRKPAQKLVLSNAQVPSKPKKYIRISRLLHHRELYGKGSFQEECKTKLVCNPKIWKYPSVEKDADGSLAQMHITVETPEGQCASNALLTGATNGSLSLFDVRNVGCYISDRMMTTAEFVWPEKEETDSYETLKDIWKINGTTLIMPSSVSSISTPKQDHLGASNDSSSLRSALITTLGSERYGGGLFILNLSDPVDLNSNMFAVGGFRELVSLDCTIWGAEITHCGRRAVVGTSQGVTLADLESRQLSTLCRSKSDVLSVQLIQSENVALCGLRNGAIITVDVRQRQSHRPLAMHKFSYPSTIKPVQLSDKSWFVVKGYIQPSRTVYMPSSICCLKSFQMDDQYFLASSMDGSIKLYDHRLTKRGPVQFYEGHVNSHSRIKLAADASERFFISGGEDCKVRIWSIKSGKMLFEEKLMDSVPMSVCWQGSPEITSVSQSSEESQYEQTHNWDAWLGSTEGLFRMQFSI